MLHSYRPPLNNNSNNNDSTVISILTSINTPTTPLTLGTSKPYNDNDVPLSATSLKIEQFANNDNNKDDKENNLETPIVSDNFSTIPASFT